MAFVLSQHGFKHVRALKGGYNAWLEAGGATVPKPAGDASKAPVTRDSPMTKKK